MRTFSVRPGNVGVTVTNVDTGDELPGVIDVVEYRGGGYGAFTREMAHHVMNARIRRVQLIMVRVVERRR